jgi:hypothetical protein
MTDDILFAEERDIPEEEMRLLIAAKEALDRLDFERMPLRSDADVIWRAIAANVLCDESVSLWARWVAQAVVRDVIDNDCPSYQRKDHALKAIKLSGRGASYKPEQEACFELMAFEYFLSRGIKKIKPDTHSLNLSKEIRTQKKRGFFDGKSEEAVRKEFLKWMKKKTFERTRNSKSNFDMK